MHVKTLKVFCDVVGQRSFSRAADDNGISQSGASQMVHQLEQELGVQLINRSKRPFVLTAEGDAFYQGCRKLVQDYYALEDRIRGMRGDVGGRVRVASIYSVGLSHIKRLVQQFQQRWPQAEIKVEYQHPDRVYESVEEDLVDFGLVSYPKSSRQIAAIAWREEPLVLVCAPEHPLAGSERVSLAELDAVDMVGFDRNLRIRQEIDRALAAARAEPRVAMEFDNIESIKRAVEINGGVSLLPEPTVAREIAGGALLALPLADVRLVRPVGIIVRRGKKLSSTAERFQEMLLADANEAAGKQATTPLPAAS